MKLNYNVDLNKDKKEDKDNRKSGISWLPPSF